MKYKKSFLIACLIICLFSISSICASDVNEKIMASDSGNLISAENQDIFGVNDEVNVLNENNNGTFSELASMIDAGKNDYSITLDKDYRFDSTNDSDYKNGITIVRYKYDSLTIDGKGHTIDGNGEAKIFDIKSNNVILKNIIFKNIYSSSSNTNAAIHGSSLTNNCIIENCSFIDINVKYGDSAITWHGNNLKINNCYFANNNANNGNLVIFYGKNINVTQCTFFNNSAISTIVYFTQFAVFSYLTDCDFINNVVSNGAVVGWIANECSMNNCSFVENSALSSATVYWTGAQGIITNSSFVSNSAYRGGAIYLDSIESTLKNCSFIDNTASYYGGAVYSKSDESYLVDSIFSNNVASYGGGLYLEGTKNTLYNTSFSDNFASNEGGAIYWTGSYGILSNSSFIQNSVSTSKNEGGAIRWNGKYGSIVNSKFINNSAYGGCAISLYGAGSNLTDCLFINNTAFGAGGAIYLPANQCNLINCFFIGNNATLLAGAIFLAGKNNVLDKSYFINNSANNGGAIIIQGDVNRLINCKFEGNNASELGGSVYLSNNDCTLDNCNFTNNFANYGGAIFIQGNNTTLNSSSFINNSASSWGGSIYWMGSEGLSVYSSFSKNSAVNGGAIFLRADNVNLSNSLFEDNLALENGSSIYWFGNNGNLTDCIIIDNIGLNQIYWWNKENGYIAGCEFINNTNSVINNGAKFIKRNVYLTGSNYVFDYKNPKEISVKLMEVLEKLPTYSNVTFFFNNGNDNANFLVSLNNYVASLFEGLSDFDAGIWNVTAIFEGDDNYNSCNTTFTLTIKPILSLLSVTTNDTIVGHKTILISNVSNLINLTINEGTVSFFDDENKIGDVYVTGGVATLNYAPTEGGEHTITAIYKANNYLSSNATVKLLVDAAVVEVLVDNGTVGFNSTFVANVKGLYSTINDGLVTFYINNKQIGTVNVVDGFASLVYDPLVAGDFTVMAYYGGSTNLLNGESSVNYTVNKADSEIIIDDINGTVGHELIITAHILSSNNLTVSDGMVSFFDGERSIGKVNVNKGIATLTYTPAIDGEHAITAMYSSDNYLSSNCSSKLLVDSASIEILVENGTVGFNSVFVANVKGLYSVINEGSVYLYVNDYYFDKAPVVNGSASFVYTTIWAGNYAIKAVYGDSLNFMDDETSTTYTVSKADSNIVINAVDGTVGNKLTLTVKVSGSNNLTVNEGTVTCYDGESKIGAVDVVEGIAAFDYTPLTAGTHLITAVYSADNYLSSNNESKVIVVKADSKIEFNKITDVYCNSPATITVRISSNDVPIREGKVKFYINGSEIEQQNVITGVNTLKYISPIAGTFEVLAVFEETDTYMSYNESCIFNVNRLPTVISSSPVTTVYNGGKYLTVTLKDQNDTAVEGVQLTVVLNTKTLTPTTDENGQVKISTDDLNPVKTYTAVLTFDGNTNYDKSTASVKVTVKKATPKLTASKKTFKRTVKTKKYTVTLKTNKNKVLKNTKLTLKVNGKTYTAKTNSKGQATFKITKLTKKGTFKATVKYAGSKYYIAKTVNPKITVK